MPFERSKRGFYRKIVLSGLALGTLGIGAAWTSSYLFERGNVLATGIPRAVKHRWFDHLKKNEIEFAYDERSRSIFVEHDPVPVLEAALKSDALKIHAGRALVERRAEARMRKLWPGVLDPRICIAFPDADGGEVSADSVPIAIVMAQGLSAGEMDAVRSEVVRDVEGLEPSNVTILGTSRRPWPGYESEKSPSKDGVQDEGRVAKRE